MRLGLDTNFQRRNLVDWRWSAKRFLIRTEIEIRLARMQNLSFASVRLQLCTFACFLLFLPLVCLGAPAKVHIVALGTVRKVPWTPPERAAEPANVVVKPAELPTLKVRPLIVDGRQKEWTTGEAHDVTDRSFTIRRALRLNDTLPGDTGARWSWQPGPWLLVDRSTGRITALHLPDFRAAERVFQLRERDGKVSDSGSGTFVAADGTPQPLHKSDFELAVLDDWRSPHTNGVYPSSWEIKIHKPECLLKVKPWMADQEINFPPVTYWEGAVHFVGSCSNAPVAGNGYIELTGYSGNLPLP